MERLNVCIIGSGNWATTIARNVGNNVAHSPLIEPKVNMYVYEEVIEGRKLTEIINSTHINVKYMPDFVLPENVVSECDSLSLSYTPMPSLSPSLSLSHLQVAYDDIVTTARDADILIFAIPPTFVNSCCKTLLGKVKPTAHAVSVIKGFERSDDGQIQLISHLIMRQLKVRFESSISLSDSLPFHSIPCRYPARCWSVAIWRTR